MRCDFALIRARQSCCICWPAALAHSPRPPSRADPQVDPAPCVAAVAANDDDKIIAACGVLIDNEKTVKADRIKALIARAGAIDRKDQIDRAIADYDVALRLDPALADIFNARGELWRKKGDRPRALADFGAAIKLNPQHAAARANYKSLALELERLGAQMAVNNKPSFNCATARRAGREGDLRQSRTGQSRPRDQRREYQGGPRRPPVTVRAPAAPCSASRMISSPAATPRSAGRITICRRRCASGWTICWRSSGISNVRLQVPKVAVFSP